MNWSFHFKIARGARMIHHRGMKIRSLLLCLFTSVFSGVTFAEEWTNADQFESSTSILRTAERGYAHGQYQMASAYVDIPGFEDHEVAFEWCRKAAEQGYKKAEALLAKMYAEGMGVAVDKATAYQWCLKAVEVDPLSDDWYNGLHDAQCLLGKLYAEGVAVAQDYEKAVEWFRAAQTQESTYILAMMYASGDGVVEDDVEAFKWIEKATEFGSSPAANYDKALMYADGEGTDQDYRRAVIYMQLAAIAGYPNAQHFLQTAEAAEWYREEAEGGVSSAQYELGRMYLKGVGVAQDDGEALKWLNLAADGEYPDKDSPVSISDGKHPEAAFLLGSMYRAGQGVVRDTRKAFLLIMGADEMGSVGAEYAIADMYLNGIGTDVNSDRAYRHLEGAANDGHVQAMHDLAWVISQGHAREYQYRPDAYKWYDIADKLGHESAKYQRDAFAKTITPHQVELGKKASSEWLAKYQKKNKK